MFQEPERKAKEICGDKACRLKHVWFNVRITTGVQNLTDVSKRHLNKDLYSIQKVCQNICTLRTLTTLDTVRTGSIIELKWMISQLGQNYSKKQNSKIPQYVFKIYNQFTVFGYIYNLMMTQRWEVHTKCVQKTSRESVNSEM
jgi:hypothetical protein